jgi:predicted transport protein
LVSFFWFLLLLKDFSKIFKIECHFFKQDKTTKMEQKVYFTKTGDRIRSNLLAKGVADRGKPCIGCNKVIVYNNGNGPYYLAVGLMENGYHHDCMPEEVREAYIAKTISNATK